MRRLISLLLSFVLVACAVETYREYTGSRIVALSKSTLHNTAAVKVLARWESLCTPVCPTRARLASAAARINFANGKSPSPRRTELLAHARRDLADAVRREPDNGEVWAALAMLEATNDSLRPAPAVLAKLGRSYHLEPFSRDAGGWRLTYAGAAWGLLTPNLRRAALDEAQWLWVIDPALRPALARAFRTEAGAGALAIRLAVSASPGREFLTTPSLQQPLHTTVAGSAALGGAMK